MSNVPSIHIMCTRSDFSRTAVSSSILENRKPPSPEMDMTFSEGRTIVAAMAQWQCDAQCLLSIRNQYLAGPETIKVPGQPQME